MKARVKKAMLKAEVEIARLEVDPVKLVKNLIFLKNVKNSKIAEMVQGSLKFFLDLR